MGWRQLTLGFSAGVGLGLVPVAALAQQAAGSQGVIGASEILTLILGLGFILLLIFGCAWLLKRMGGLSSKGTGAIKVLSVLPLGTRERLALIEVGGQQLLIGVTAQQVTLLHSFKENSFKENSVKEPVAGSGAHPHTSEFAQKLHRLMSRH